MAEFAGLADVGVSALRDTVPQYEKVFLRWCTASLVHSTCKFDLFIVFIKGCKCFIWYYTI